MFRCGRGKRRRRINAYIRDLARLNRDVKLYLVALAVFGLTMMNGIYPVLFNLYLLRLGYGAEFIGMLSAVGLLGYTIFSFPASIIGSRLGVHRAMTLGMAVAVLFFGVQPLLQFDAVIWNKVGLLVSRPIATMGLALIFVNSTPFLSGATSAQERNHAYSMRGVADALSGFFGSLIGGVLPGLLAPLLGVSPDDPLSFRYALLIATVLCTPAIVALFAIREPHHTETGARTAASVGAAPVQLIVVMALAVMLRSTGVGASRTFFNVYLDDGLGVPTIKIGALFAVAQLIAALVVMTMPVMAKRWGNYRLILWGSCGIAVSLLPLALIPNWIAATLGRIGIYTLSSVTDPAIGVFQMESVSPRWRSMMAGASSMALGASWTIFAFGGGYMIVAFSYRALFLTAAALTVVGAALFGFYFRTRTQGEFQPGC